MTVLYSSFTLPFSVSGDRESLLRHTLAANWDQNRISFDLVFRL